MTHFATREESELIAKIAQRAVALDAAYDTVGVAMDIEAVHCNCVRLSLQTLFEFQQFDFVHDVCGIARHLNRNTLKLEDRFFPRSAACYHER